MQRSHKVGRRIMQYSHKVDTIPMLLQSNFYFLLQVLYGKVCHIYVSSLSLTCEFHITYETFVYTIDQSFM